MTNSSASTSALSTSTALENWETIVDRIRANQSTAQLPDCYDPEDFIPLSSSDGGDHPSLLLTDELAKALFHSINEKMKNSSKDSNSATSIPDPSPTNLFAEEANKIFQPQLTLLESLHARPSIAHFSSMAKSGVYSSLVTGTVPSASGLASTLDSLNPGSEKMPSVEEILDKVFSHEGPNFLKTYERSNESPSEKDNRNGTSAHRHRHDVDSKAISSLRSVKKRKLHESSGAFPPTRMALTSGLTSGFMNREFFAAIHLKPDFIPIILAPCIVTAPIQLFNVKRFLEEGSYVDPSKYYIDEETGAASIRRAKPEQVFVSAAMFKRNISTKVSFKQFRVLDDPDRVENWDHVCGAIVTGKTYQFESWFPQEHRRISHPSNLFQRVAGFLPYFEEDPIPVGVQQWNVKPLLLTKRMVKEQRHIREASRFWEALFQFLDLCPLFNKYTEE